MVVYLELMEVEFLRMEVVRNFFRKTFVKFLSTFFLAHISRNEAEAQSVEAGVIYCEGNFSFESDKSFHFTRTIPKLIDDLRNDKDLEFVIECDLKEFRVCLF